MQINRTGYGLLALFGLGGIGFILLLPWNPIGYIWVAVTLGLIVYAFRERFKGKRKMEVFKSGIRGKATIVEAGSGMVVNDQPRMNFKLDLDVPGLEARQVEHTEIVSNFVAQRMRPGMVLPVVLDPKKPEDLVLVW